MPAKSALFKLFVALMAVTPSLAMPMVERDNDKAPSNCKNAEPGKCAHAEEQKNKHNNQQPPAVPDRKRCVVKALGGTQDDSPNINQAFKDCNNGGTVAFEYGANYNAFTPVNALKLDDVHVEFLGSVHLPQDIPYVQNIVANSSDYSGHWFRFTGKNLKWYGTKDVATGWIESYGQAWWDANPAGKSGLANRPHLITFEIDDSEIYSLKSRQPIGWNARIKANNLYIKDTVVETYTTGGYPFNTDGLGFSGSNILAEDSYINNGDDCFAITTPSYNITAIRATCGGPGSHGLSIGSLGKNQAQFNNVTKIHFEDITMIDALYGARFKSWVGGQGITDDVVWKNIRLYNVTYPALITQTYIDQNNPGPERVDNGSVILKNFKFEDWTGDINSYQPGDGTCLSDPCWYEQDLPPFTGSQVLAFSCANAGSCQGFETKNINVFGQNGKPSENLCKNADAESNPELGFACTGL
ncbi:hypothetical protein NliqN6_2769 [Naganishia liquefaciens]|uniref:galacturonan 1,4-alpha-galacturonidase n=1 Tax=Naganishia liquefaciens TaxID=104408 RepID=A0A8H3YFM7_9TREE|nr:hypothetical protein NliqN6_2769 [Naganishia liquefaciens]